MNESHSVWAALALTYTESELQMKTFCAQLKTEAVNVVQLLNIVARQSRIELHRHPEGS